MNWTIGRRLTALSALGMIATFGVAAAGWTDLTRVGAANDHVSMVQGVLRNHLEADMMHDAIRADVLNALGATTPAELSEAQTDLGEHGKQFVEMLGQNRSAPVAAEIKSTLEEMTGALNDYLASAKSIQAAAAINQSDRRGVGAARARDRGKHKRTEKCTTRCRELHAQHNTPTAPCPSSCTAASPVATRPQARGTANPPRP